MTIVLGNPIIPTQKDIDGQKKKFDIEELSKSFSDGVPKIAYEEPVKKRSPVKNITPENLPHLESVDIKENWEKISQSTSLKARSLESNPEMTSKSIRPSRAAGENNLGGTGILPGMNNTLADPDRIGKIKNSEFATQAKAAGKEKRKQKEEKGRNTNWEDEVDLVAKTTKDVPVTATGIIPNRSAFQPAPLPEANLNITKKEKIKAKRSAEAGVVAAQMKRQLDAVMQSKKDNISNHWEEEALANINEKMKMKVIPGNSGVKIAKDFTSIPSKQKKTEMSLDGLFAIPENPKTASNEKSIKRDSSVLKEKRATRESDRSWETVVRSKKTK